MLIYLRNFCVRDFAFSAHAANAAMAKAERMIIEMQHQHQQQQQQQHFITAELQERLHHALHAAATGAWIAAAAASAADPHSQNSNVLRA